jgi:regulator of nucleoside diphosphate kinase
MAANTMIRLTEQDYNRVKRLLAELTHQSRGMQASLKILEEVLELARVVHPEKISNSAVTMNSLVHFEDVRTQEKGTVTIVYPADADPPNGKVSVLDPVGAALIGESRGKQVEIPTAHGQTRRIRILNVLYQPEAQSDFAL